MKGDKSTSIEKKNLISLSLSSIAITIGFGVIIPFFPLYADEILTTVMIFNIFEVGIALQVGILTSAFMFVRFLLAPSFGDMSDITGRKPIILVGMSIYGVLMILFGFSYDFFTLLLLRALQGLASAAVWPVGEALIVDSSPSDRIGKNLGYYMLSMQAGMALGPFLGFFLYSFYKDLLLQPIIISYRLSFFSVGVLGILATVIVAYMVEDPKVSSKTPIKTLYLDTTKSMVNKIARSPSYIVKTFTNGSDSSYRDKNLIIIYITAVINGFGNAMIFPLITLFLSDYFLMDVGEISIIIGVIGLISLIGAPIGGYISDHTSKPLTVSASGLIRGFLFLFLGLQGNIIGILILLTGQRFLFAILQPAFRAMQSDYVPEHVRGKEFGIVQALFNLGSVMGPIIGGFLYDIFFMKDITIFGEMKFLGAGVPFAISGILAICAAIIIFFEIDSEKQPLSN